MKISLREVTEDHPFTLALAGSEPWLEGLYQQYPTPKGQEKPLLVGTIEIVRFDEQNLLLTGKLEYSPFVDCSRCSDPIPWPIKERLHLNIRSKSGDTLPEEIDMEGESLDDALAPKEDEIDLESIINETVVLAFPIRTVRLSEDQEDCLICFKKSLSDHVFSTDTEGKTNPFAKLKDLKFS